MLLGACAAAWAFFGPEPYEIIIGLLIALPWAAMAAVKLSGEYILAGSEGDAAGMTNLFKVAFFPSLALAGRSAEDFTQIDWRPACGSAAAIAIGLILVIRCVPQPDAAEIGRRGLFKCRRLWRLTVLLPLAMTGIFGLATLGNGYGDDGLVRTARVAVVAKRIASYKGRSFQLDLAPSPLTSPTGTEIVSRDIYNAIEPGGAICIDEHAGRFGWPWRRVHLCGQPSRATEPSPS